MSEPRTYSHLTLTGYYAGRPLCDGVKDPTVTHYHAMYAPACVLASPDTCPACLRLWNESEDTQMIGWNEQRAMVEEAMRAFPATFGLRAFPGLTFRVSASSSYVNDSDVVMLYTEVNRDGKWLSFAKGTASELRRELTEVAR